ncbi:MAG: hypothetical protein JO297_09210 [Nitrososphaeraceae archaeon]|nr:hypothetical protein [Nitrososphaeraceae archaeon]
MISIQAQQTKVIKRENAAKKNMMRVAATLFGIDNHTGSFLTFVTVKNITKAVVSNTAERDLRNRVSSGALVVSLSFPHGITKAGDQIRACSIILKNLKIFCSVTKMPFVDTNIIFVQLFLNSK